MKKTYRQLLASLLLGALLLTGCSTSATSQTSQTATTTASTTTASAATTGTIVTYDENDTYSDYTKASPITITLDGTNASTDSDSVSIKDGTVTITKAGTYVLTGTYTDGQIVVAAGEKDVVRLVLNNTDIICSDSSAISLLSAKKVILSLPEGSKNTLTDGAAYSADAEEAGNNAVIYSKADLTVNGTGALTINANYNNGINSRDDLKIMEGTYVIQSKDDGIIGKDLLAIKDGTFTINSEGDAIKSSNDEDTAKGNVWIDGGTFTISAGDDAIHAEQLLTINDGDIVVTKSYEGLEGASIVINGGTCDITSSDDGINAASGNSSTKDAGTTTDAAPSKDTTASSDNTLTINGGTIKVLAQGDGIDVNGNIYITGGTISVDGPTANNNAPVDFDGVLENTGGTLIAAGSSGMALAPTENSTVYSMAMTFAQAQKSGTAFRVEDSDGKTIATYTPRVDYQYVLISSPSLVKDASYTVYTGDTKIVTFTLSDISSWVNEDGVTTQPAGMGQGGMGKGGFDGGDRPSGQRPDRQAPDGDFPGTPPDVATESSSTN